MHSARLVEWQNGAVFCAIGLALALPVPTLEVFLYEPFARLMPEKAWAVFFIAVGAVRLAALHVNGRMPAGSPAIRALAAIITCAALAFVATTFFLRGPTGLWAASAYSTMAVFEALIAYRATRELRHVVDPSHA